MHLFRSYAFFPPQLCADIKTWCILVVVHDCIMYNSISAAVSNKWSAYFALGKVEVIMLRCRSSKNMVYTTTHAMYFLSIDRSIPVFSGPREMICVQCVTHAGAIGRHHREDREGCEGGPVAFKLTASQEDG